ncbi:hypothetical protein GALMADRAFT_147501 [Galerina marginata CBS 339.88]|uniref:Uncharacterized protein n=1 Tax=Galerina marginata (strain CBS 339.88) TaxID=685588 RepID=A0A067S7L0_GALM3|nr:hypothetical protein GALMADRAFT_147501 [Galerina marginata CBS 339.88]
MPQRPASTSFLRRFDRATKRRSLLLAVSRSCTWKTVAMIRGHLVDFKAKSSTTRPQPSTSQIVPAMNSQPMPNPPPTPLNLTPKPKSVHLYNANLQVLLDWAPGDYMLVQDTIHRLAKKYLDVSLSLSKQDGPQITLLLELASSECPVLGQYTGGWVTSEFLRRFLKNTSSRSKNKTR